MNKDKEAVLIALRGMVIIDVAWSAADKMLYMMRLTGLDRIAISNCVTEILKDKNQTEFSESDLWGLHFDDLPNIHVDMPLDDDV